MKWGTQGQVQCLMERTVMYQVNGRTIREKADKVVAGSPVEAFERALRDLWDQGVRVGSNAKDLSITIRRTGQVETRRYVELTEAAGVSDGAA